MYSRNILSFYLLFASVIILEWLRQIQRMQINGLNLQLVTSVFAEFAVAGRLAQ